MLDSTRSCRNMWKKVELEKRATVFVYKLHFNYFGWLESFGLCRNVKYSFRVQMKRRGHELRMKNDEHGNQLERNFVSFAVSAARFMLNNRKTNDNKRGKIEKVVKWCATGFACINWSMTLPRRRRSFSFLHTHRHSSHSSWTCVLLVETTRFVRSQCQSKDRWKSGQKERRDGSGLRTNLVRSVLLCGRW